MNRKTFFIFITGITILLTSFFIVQLYSLPEDECYPNVMADGCLDSMESWCNSENAELMGFILFGSWCDGGKCYAIWDFYCQRYGEANPRKYSMPCVDDSAVGCDSD